MQKSLKVYLTEEKPDFITRIYKTDFHSLKVRDKVLERFNAMLERRNRKGNPKYTDEEKHFKRCLWLMRRVSPRESKMSGSDWERSMRSLLKKVFNDDWDRKPGGEKVIGRVSGSEDSAVVEASA